ncbi:MAG: hypothetical protein ACE5PM_00955 [Candidatus Hydrothermarchaeales archaeon]
MENSRYGLGKIRNVYPPVYVRDPLSINNIWDKLDAPVGTLRARSESLGISVFHPPTGPTPIALFTSITKRVWIFYKSDLEWRMPMERRE